MPRLPVSAHLRRVLEHSPVPFVWLLARYRWSIPAVTLLGLLSSLLEGIGIGLLIPLVGLLLTDSVPASMPAPISALAAETAQFERHFRVLALGGGVMAFIAIKGVIQGGYQAFIATLHGKLLKDLRVLLAEKSLSLDYGFFLQQERSRLVQIISEDSWYAAESLRQLLTVISAITTLIVFSGFLLYFEWRLALVALAGAILVQAVLVLVERRQRALSALLTPLENALMGRVLAILMGMRSIKVFGREEKELEEFESNADILRQNLSRRERVAAFVLPATDILVSCIFVAILLLAIYLGVSLPVTTAFLVLLSRTQPYAQAISRARVQIAAVSGSARQAEWLFRQRLLPASIAGDIPVPAIDRDIRFESVSYTYTENDPALYQADCTLRAGSVTALIGASGAGKTTLVNLLARLIEPTGGAIRHGGTPISLLDPVQWRSRLAIAGQDIDLSEGTVADIIASGRPGALTEEIEDAAHAAGALQFIRSLPNGLDTRLGLDGLSLSGGQRQRIALARALVRRPDLLILDEATNAVDSISENEFFRIVSGHRYFRSALVISHRRSTLAACDEGIVLEAGRVIETGPLGTLAYFSKMA